MKCTSRVAYNHEDVKTSLFILSLEYDALQWFLDEPSNSFDSLQTIIGAFKDKCGIKEKDDIYLNLSTVFKRTKMRQ